MNKMRFGIYSLIYFFLVLLPAGHLRAQTGFVSGKTIPSIELDNLVQGRLAVSEHPGVKGSPYLLLEYLPGNILYLDHEYQGLPLRYDIADDELIFLHRSEAGIQKIQLTRNFIRYFTLEKRRFINLDYSPYRNSALKSGYYEVMFEDALTLLAKRGVIIEQRESQSYFKLKNSWFLIKGGQVYKISNKKSLLSAFDESDKKPISSFLRKQTIRLRKADDKQWLQLAAYLNTLLQST